MTPSVPLPGLAAIRQWVADDTPLKRLLTAQRWMMRAYFEARYTVVDPWHLATSSYEQARARAMLGILGARRYGSAIDVGCGEGTFTSRLLERCDQIVGVDFSSLAIRRARRRFAGRPRVEIRQLDVRIAPLERTFDLVFCAELFYYLTRAEADTVGRRLVRWTAPGGDVCLVHGTSSHDAGAPGGRASSGAMGASAIHAWFRRVPALAVVRDVIEPRYRLTLLRRIEAPDG